MGLKEAMTKLKEINDENKKLRGSRWWTREYIYFKEGRFYMENNTEFNDECVGRELLTCPHEKYYIE